MRAGVFLLIACACTSDVQIDASTHYQVMSGWEALADVPYGCSEASWRAVRSGVVELAANDVGINRLRIPLRAGSERPTNPFAQYVSGKIDYEEWKATWHVPINDNDDPHVAAASGFHWDHLDSTIVAIALPLRDLLRARGESLWINVIHPAGGGAALHRDNPEEYAEFILEGFLHLKDRWGLVPQSLEVLNEPNLGKWIPDELGRAIVAVRARLAAAGFHPRIVAPSASTVDQSVRYYEALLRQPGVGPLVTDLSYHRYGGGRNDLERVGFLAESLGVQTAMSEKIAANTDILYEDLTIARASSWQQFALVYCPEEHESGGLYLQFADKGDQSAPTLHVTALSQRLRHYFRHVHIGARRIGARVAFSSRKLRALAFENPTGDLVAVIENLDSRARSVRVSGMAAGRYLVWRNGEGASPHTDTVTVDRTPVTVALSSHGIATIHAQR